MKTLAAQIAQMNADYGELQDKVGLLDPEDRSPLLTNVLERLTNLVGNIIEVLNKLDDQKPMQPHDA